MAAGITGELLLIWRLKDGGGNHCEFFWMRWGINVLDVQVEGWRREWLVSCCSWCAG
jgi:hypothetical protein